MHYFPKERVHRENKIVSASEIPAMLNVTSDALHQSGKMHKASHSGSNLASNLHTT